MADDDAGAPRDPTPDRSAARPPISAYIRTLNEERMIGAVVRAALCVAREAIIVDSGSTDATRAIAEAAGARVLDQPWLGNGGQKRVGEEAAAHDWLLDLDGDEIVTEELAAEIRALFEAGEPPLGVYRMDLVTAPPIGEPWPFYRDPRAKLYDRRRFRIPDHKAWDQLELGDAPVGRLEGALMHHSFRDLEHYLAKWNRVSSVRARETRLKSYPAVVLRVLFARPVYFWRHYLLRGLWRAGLYGLIIARNAAFGRWLRDAKMYERWRRSCDE